MVSQHCPLCSEGIQSRRGEFLGAGALVLPKAAQFAIAQIIAIDQDDVRPVDPAGRVHGIGSGGQLDSIRQTVAIGV